MARIFINGLYYNNMIGRGLKVNLFDNISSNGSFGSLIFEKESDSEGTVSGELDDSYVGNEVILSIIEPGFIPIQDKISIKEIGLFHTPKLELDRAYTGSQNITTGGPEWKSNLAFNNAHAELVEKIRNYKFKNVAIKYIHYFILIVSILVSIIIPFPLSILFTVIFIIIGEILSPYLLGLKPFWRKKKS